MNMRLTSLFMALTLITAPLTVYTASSGASETKSTPSAVASSDGSATGSNQALGTAPQQKPDDSSREKTKDFLHKKGIRTGFAGLGTVCFSLWLKSQNEYTSTAVKRFPLAQRRTALTRSLDRGLQDGELKRSTLKQLDYIQGDLRTISDERRKANTRRWIFGLATLGLYALAIAPSFMKTGAPESEEIS